MSGILHSRNQVPDVWLIGANRVGYVVLSAASLIGVFVLSAMFGAEADMSLLVLLAAMAALGAFNVVGVLRPKQMLLSAEGVRYRPVLGSAVSVAWQDIQSVGFVHINYGSGVLTCRDRAGRTRRLGFWLDLNRVGREVEDWRNRHA